MEFKIKTDITEVKRNTGCIHESLLHVGSFRTECTCKDIILELKKDLQALEARLSIKEEECLRQRHRHELGKNARANQFEEVCTRLDNIRTSIKTIQSNQSLDAKPALCKTSATVLDSAKVNDRGDANDHTTRGERNVTKESAPFSTADSSTPNQRSKDVRIKRQSERRDSMDLERWQLLASQELEKVSLVTRPLDGFHTVLLLDISESMASEDSWKKAKTFVNDFLCGLEDQSCPYEPHLPINEHVGLVTFGHQTQAEVPLTKDFKVIRNKIENLELGGPSPLAGGLLVAHAIVQSARNFPKCINNVSMHNKIIVITDGHPTEVSLSSGPDVVDESQVDEERAMLLCMFDELTAAKISVFFIEVPNRETAFFRCIRCDDPYRNVFDCNSGRRLARRNNLCAQLIINGAVAAGVPVISERNLNTEDYEDMCDIAATSCKHVANVVAARARPSDTYRESNSKTLPIIGSRVRRGPDWKWDDQDGDGPGTVIGHFEDDCMIWVEWDKTHRGYYRYGKGFFDVLIVDEVRRLKPGELMDVGCYVKPGRDGTFRNVHSWNKGVVIQMKPPKAQVRWDSGIRGDYSYGADGKFEIELCDSDSTTPTDSANADKTASRSENKT